MESVLIAPADAHFFGIPLVVFSVFIPIISITLFGCIIARRMAPIVKSAPDERFDHIPKRIIKFIT